MPQPQLHKSTPLTIFILKQLRFFKNRKIMLLDSHILLHFCDRLILRKAKFMFKVYHNMTPTYINENFNLRNNLNTSVNLRSMNVGCFIPPKPHTECFKQSMRYSGCLIWNSLPDDVKSSETRETFHRRCLKWLIDKAS